jgi:hypothetical protein
VGFTVLRLTVCRLVTSRLHSLTYSRFLLRHQLEAAHKLGNAHLKWLGEHFEIADAGFLLPFFEFEINPHFVLQRLRADSTKNPWKTEFMSIQLPVMVPCALMLFAFVVEFGSGAAKVEIWPVALRTKDFCRI